MAPRTGVGTVTRRSRGFWQAGRGQLAELRSVGPFSLTPTGELAVRVQRNFLQFFFAWLGAAADLRCALSAAPIFKHRI